MRLSRAVFLLAILGLSACGADGRLRDLRSNTGGPDEFSVLPSKELQQPSTYAALPVPTPGGSNITDQNPRGDAVAALGGRASALVPTGIPASEGNLVSYASRNGVDPQIRGELAEEDAQFRKRQARFTRIRITKVDRYKQAYRRQLLKSHDEAARWRAAGVRVPTAPPEDQ